MSKEIKVRYYSKLLGKVMFKSFDGIEKAVSFANSVKGILVP